MRSFFTVRNLTAAVSGTVLTGLVLSGAAYAISSTAFRYSSAQTGYMTFQGQVFVPRDSNAADHYASSLSSGLMTTASNFYSTPVHLPNRAKITEIRAWYKTATTVYLLRSRLIDGVGDSPASKSFSDASGNVTPGVIRLAGSPITIDNAHYSYSLQVFGDVTGAFYNGRITYTYTNAGD